MKALIATCLMLISGWATAQSFIPVLMYHHVTNEMPVGPTVVSATAFEQQVKWLKDNRYNTLTISQLTEYLNKGKKLPERTVAITFDDGWHNQLAASEILAAHNFSATFYVISNSFGKGSYLAESDIVALANNKLFEIGAHTHTHLTEFVGALEKVDLRIYVGEMIMSKTLIERAISKPVTTFAWPYGFYTRDALAYAKNLGFTSTVTVVSTADNRIGDSPYEIKRINVEGTCNIEQFAEMIRSAQYNHCGVDTSRRQGE